MAPTPHRPQRCWRREAWDSALPTSVHARPPHPCPPTFLTPVRPPSSLLSAHLPHSSAHLAPGPPSSPVCKPQSMSTLLTPICPPHPCPPALPVCPPQSTSTRLTLSARLSPCPPSSPVCSSHPCMPTSVHVRPPHPPAHLTRLPISVHVHPPHPVCRLSPCPPSSPVCSSHPSARLTPVCLPQPCLLSSPVCPPTHSPPSSAWSKCLTRLRRPTFPWGLGLQEVPTLVQRPRAGGPAQSGSVRCSRSPQDTASRTHMAAQAGGRPCMRVGKGEGAVASAGSSGKGSPSRTQKAPDTNRA